MRVAITGAGGQIGRALSRHLATRGFSQTLVGRSLTRLLDAVPPEADGTRAPLVRLVQTDYRDATGLTKGLHGAGAVVHLAAAPHHPDWSPADYERENERATEVCFAAAAELGIKNIVFASSRSVYDPDVNDVPFTEGQECHPTTAYGQSKLRCEATAARYVREHGLCIKALRLGQVLGPRAREGSMLQTFMDQANAGLPLPVWGTGSGARDYVHVQDVARAIELALSRPEVRGVFNISSGTPTTHLQFAEAVNRVLRPESGEDNLARLREHEADESVQMMDCTRARHELGWSPQHDLDTMIADAVSRALDPRQG